MSRPRWWNYVQTCIRDYPAKCAEQESIKEWMTQPDGEALAVAQTPRRPTEIKALRNIAKQGLTGQRGAEYHAVRLALKDTFALDDGQERVAFIGLLYSDANGSLKSAIARSGVTSETAKLWRGEFVRRIAFHLGLLRERRTAGRPAGAVHKRGGEGQ